MGRELKRKRKKFWRKLHNNYARKIKMEIHFKDTMSTEAECKKEGEASWNLKRVNCIKCLELVKKEWERQTKLFSGQPKINAIEGLSMTQKRIREVQER